MTKKSSTPAIRFKGFTDTWEQRKLGDMMNVTSVKRIHQSDWTDSGVRFLRARDIVAAAKNEEPDDYLYISKEKYEEYSALSGKVGVSDLLVTGVGTIGVPYLVRNLEPLYFKDGNIIWFQNSDKIDGKFLFYSFSAEQIQGFINESAGIGTVGTYTIESGKKTPISLPNQIEQAKVGEFFQQLDNLITLHQRKYDKLTNVKKSMLEKMFPKNGSNVPEIRFKGFTEAWEQRKLSEIATMHARIGWQNLRTSEFLDSGDYMLITGTDFIDGAVNFDTCHYVERERYEQDKHIQIRNGSILITKDGTLGKVAYIQGLTMPATLNAGVFNVEIKDENEVDNRYLFQYLKAPFLMDYVDKKATGGTIKHLNQNILVDFPVVLPHKAEQEKIGEYFLAIDHLITLHQRELEKLKNLKKACLEKMFV